jgi:hypothetical protein
MITIRSRLVYIHQGATLHPKLAYGVPDAVAAGLCGLGIADTVQDQPDLVLDNLTWPTGMALADGHIVPDAMVHSHDSSV